MCSSMRAQLDEHVLFCSDQTLWPSTILCGYCCGERGYDKMRMGENNCLLVSQAVTIRQPFVDSHILEHSVDNAYPGDACTV